MKSIAFHLSLAILVSGGGCGATAELTSPSPQAPELRKHLLTIRGQSPLVYAILPNGTTARLLVDTGAHSLILAKDVAESVDLGTSGTEVIAMKGRPVSATYGRLELKIDGVLFSNLTVHLVDRADAGGRFYGLIDGLIHPLQLNDAGFVFDTINEELLLGEPPWAPESPVIASLLTQDNHIMIRTDEGWRFLIDTGTPQSCVSQAYSDRHGVGTLAFTVGGACRYQGVAQSHPSLPPGFDGLLGFDAIQALGGMRVTSAGRGLQFRFSTAAAARSYLEKESHKGNARASLALWRVLVKPTPDSDFEPLSLLKEAARDLDAAKCILGRYYALTKGLGEEQQRRGFRLLSECSSFDPDRYGWLGACYGNGIGTSRDWKKAKSLFETGARLGSVLCLEGLALLLLSEGGAKSKEGKALMEQAAVKGNLSAMVRLGYLCENGIGSDPDRAAAAKYYRRAAENDEPFGALHYARCLEHGIGVPSNAEDAAAWYRTALKRGLKEAEAALLRLGAKP